MSDLTPRSLALLDPSARPRASAWAIHHDYDRTGLEWAFEDAKLDDGTGSRYSTKIDACACNGGRTRTCKSGGCACELCRVLGVDLFPTNDEGALFGNDFDPIDVDVSEDDVLLRYWKGHRYVADEDMFESQLIICSRHKAAAAAKGIEFDRTALFEAHKASVGKARTVRARNAKCRGVFDKRIRHKFTAQMRDSSEEPAGFPKLRVALLQVMCAISTREGEEGEAMVDEIAVAACAEWVFESLVDVDVDAASWICANPRCTVATIRPTVASIGTMIADRLPYAMLDEAMTLLMQAYLYDLYGKGDEADPSEEERAVLSLAAKCPRSPLSRRLPAPSADSPPEPTCYSSRAAPLRHSRRS